MLGALLDLVMPPRCAGCGVPGYVACPACLTELLGEPTPRSPHPRPPGLPECWSATGYDGPTRRMILACKERGRTAVVPVLARCVAEVVSTAFGWRVRRSPSLPGTGRAADTSMASADRSVARPLGDRSMTGPPVVLVPVPSARTAVRRRGHDPVQEITHAAADELRGCGLPVTAACLLRQARRVADQAGLGWGQRAENLRGAFEALPGDSGWPRPGGTIVVVDDIVTTGATLAEAARAIRAAGAEVPLAVTIAATRRKQPTRRNGRVRAA